jgi:tRNA(Ile)-lysidine synthase
MPLSLVVGLSGGLDSTVLLHLLSQVHQKLPNLFALRAVHVHHGLQSAADQFVVQCQELCTDLDVPLEIARVDIPAQEIRDLGLEAAARKYRYEALTQHMDRHAVLVLAHHRDDLLETALLQWIRGAGLEGLSAMNRFSYHGMTRWRPLLDYGRADLLAYATGQGLRWIEDPSNHSADMARNRIRHEVMPVLRSLRQGADTAMARSILHLQTARELLDLVTEEALRDCEDEPGELAIPALLAEDEALAARILRSWLKEQGAPVPPTRRLAEFLRQIREAREPFAQMDLTDPLSGQLWRVLRVRDRLRIAR